MDRAKLDELIARLASGGTRRTAVKGVLGGALASVGALAESIAKGKGKKNKGKKRTDGKQGDGKQRGKNARGGGGHAERQSADVGTEAKTGAASKGKDKNKKRCKKNGRNCGERAAGDQQLSAV